MEDAELRKHLDQLDSQELVPRNISDRLSTYSRGGSWNFKSGRGSVTAMVSMTTRLRRQDDPSRWVQTFFMEGEITVGSVESGGYEERINFCFLTWDDANSSESRYPNSYNIPKNVFISLEEISYNAPFYQEIPSLTVDDKDIIARFLEKIAGIILQETAEDFGGESKISGHFINNWRNPRQDVVQFHQKLWETRKSFDLNSVADAAWEGFTFESQFEQGPYSGKELRKWPGIRVIKRPLVDRDDPSFERITTWIGDDQFEFEYQRGATIQFDPPILIDGSPVSRIKISYIFDPFSPFFVPRTPFHDGPITDELKESTRQALIYSKESLMAWHNSLKVKFNPSDRDIFITI